MHAKAGAVWPSLALLAAILALWAPSTQAQPPVRYAEPGDESNRFQTQIVLSDLDNPVGLALRPHPTQRGVYEIFVAESGAGRVVRVAASSRGVGSRGVGSREDGSQEDGSRQAGALEPLDEVVVGFTLGSFGQQPTYRVGPLGLAFISRTKLVVGAKGERPGDDRLVCFSLPNSGAPRNAAEPDHAVGPLDPKLASQVDDLQFAGLAISDKTLFVTSGGKDSQGWILKSGVEANRLAMLQAFLKTENNIGWGGPAGIAVIPPPRPPFLVIGLMGSRDIPRDSRLAFLVSASGELGLDLPTGLHDIMSLAYSPSGQLYAADFSWRDEETGGVYRIDDARLDGRQTCRAVKIASVVRPVSLAFAPDGALFVTAFGPGENAKQGTVVKITGEL